MLKIMLAWLAGREISDQKYDGNSVPVLTWVPLISRYRHAFTHHGDKLTFLAGGIDQYMKVGI